MDRDALDRRDGGTVFIASRPKSVPAETDRRIGPIAPFTTFLASPPRVVETRLGNVRPESALALLITAVIGLAVIPELITYLNVKHSPDLLSDDSSGDSKYPPAQLIRYAVSAVLLALSSIIAIRHGRRNRDASGAIILLLALNLPYLTSPVTPGIPDLVKLVFANAFILAVWSIGAPIAQLKWIPIVVTGIGVYSLVGGLVLPDYMMYNTRSMKAIIPGWELAGPFGRANVLGVYCAIAFSFLPLLPERRWRIVCGLILLTTTAASASRTGLIAIGLVVLWWAICWLRSVVSVRLVGTFFVVLTGTAMIVAPFLPWDPSDLSYRASVWTSALQVWERSPLFGQGVNWFLTDAQQTENDAVWAYVGTGHNLVIDTLVKSGLVGLAVLLPVLVGALVSVRALTIRPQQIACFGYLIVYLVVATTEAVWSLLPNIQLFPISGMIFAVLVLSRRGGAATGARS